MSESIYNGITKFDISKTKIIPDNAYDGVVLNKMTVYDGNKFYLIKGRSENQRKFIDFDGKTIISLNNSIISEHISSKIINLISMDSDTKAHNTMLVDFGGYPYVACEHYLFNTYGENIAIKFHQLVTNQLLRDNNNDINKYTLNDLNNILRTINSQNYMDKEKLLRRFWNQFVLDILLLNWDRHSGNWGLIYNKNIESFDLLPIYDQGSTLMSKLDSSALSFSKNKSVENKYISYTIKTVEDLIYDNIEELKNQILEGVYETTSAINIDGQRINYFDFIKSYNNIDFFESIKLLLDNFNIDEVNSLIEKELYFNNKYINFYKILIDISFNEIILKGLKENKHYQKWLLKSEK